MTLGSHPHFSESITMFWIWHHTNEHNVVGINLDKRGRFHHHHHHDDNDGPDIINMDDMAFLWRSTESLWHFFIGPLDNLLWHGLSVARYDSQWKFSGGEGNISCTRSSACISSPEECHQTTHILPSPTFSCLCLCQINAPWYTSWKHYWMFVCLVNGWERILNHQSRQNHISSWVLSSTSVVSLFLLLQALGLRVKGSVEYKSGTSSGLFEVAEYRSANCSNLTLGPGNSSTEGSRLHIPEYSSDKLSDLFFPEYISGSSSALLIPE